MAAPTQEAQREKQSEGQVDEGGVDLSKATTNKPVKEGKKRVNQPTYGLEPVSKLPDPPARISGREELYVGLLAPALEAPGKLFRVAHFATPTGAGKAETALTDGSGSFLVVPKLVSGTSLRLRWRTLMKRVARGTANCLRCTRVKV